MLIACLVEGMQRPQDDVPVVLDDVAVLDHFFQDVVRLLDVEHDVQLADRLEVLVESLHDVVDEGVVHLLVLVFFINSHDEVQTGVSPVDNSEVLVLEERALRDKILLCWWTGRDIF